MNPYYDVSFFEWFILFFQRVSAFLSVTGQPIHLASDEIQVIVLCVFAMNAGLLGSFLLLKRLTMMANAISHTMILGIVLAYISYMYISQHGQEIATHQINHNTTTFEIPEYLLLIFSNVVALLTAFLTQFLSEHRLIKEDASNAIVFTSLFALGITLVSTITKNAHTGTELLMGNPDALVMQDIWVTLYMFLFSVVFSFVFFRGIYIGLFDHIFGTIHGFRPKIMTNMVLCLVSLTLVSSFRAVGFVMSLAFFVIPPMMAKLFSKNMYSLCVYSAIFGGMSAFISVALSRHFLTIYGIAVSTGALSVTVLALCFAGMIVAKNMISKMSKVFDIATKLNTSFRK